MMEGMTLYIYMMTIRSDLLYSTYINGQGATLPDFISPAFIRTQMAINGTWMPN